MAKLTGVRAKGGSIEIRFKHKGQDYSFYVNEPPTETNLANAARYRASLIQKVRLGEDIEEHSAENPTFEECCREYLKAKQGDLKPSTLNSYRQKLECYWSPLAFRGMQDIRLPHIRAIDRAIEWKSQKTRREAISNLKQVFKFAMDEDIIHTDPSIKMRAGKWQKPEIDAFSAEEKAAILANLSGKYLLFYTLQFETGARTGELQALKWADVRGQSIRIERSMYKGQIVTTKTHAMRSVLLTDVAKAALKAFTETRFGSGWMFQNYMGDTFAHDRSLTIQFKKACEAAEVRYRRPYNCRHTYATLGLMRGCKPGFISNQMGDRTETVLRNYATWISGEQDKEELALLNDKGGQKVGKEEEPKS